MDEAQKIAELVESYTRLGLAKLCQEKNLPATGTKEDMAARIVAEQPTQEAVEVSNPLNSTMYVDAQAGGSVGMSVMSFHDVKDALPTFTGDRESLDVQRFVADFEESSVLFGWNDLQKLVFAKRLMRGPAKMFVNNSGNLNTWKSLKTALLTEFTQVVSSVDVHEALRKRKKRSTETFLEFIYAMQAIACKGGVDERSTCEYIVRGIEDDPRNKVCLLGVSTIAELKIQLKKYELLKSQLGPTYSHPTRSSHESNMKRTIEDPSKQQQQQQVPKKYRCYRCQQYGHLAKNCSDKEQKVNTISSGKLYPSISVTIYEHKIDAMVDTGSDLTLMREDLFQQIQELQGKLKTSTQVVRGYGGHRSTIRGEVQVSAKFGEIDRVCNFCVVPKNAINAQLLIGMDILNSANYVISNDCVQLTERVEENETDYNNHHWVQQISVDVEELVVPDKFRDKITSLVEQCQCRNNSQVKRCSVEMEIVPDAQLRPFRDPPRRLAYSEEKAVNEQVDEWLQKGIVRASTSDFASRVVVVKKKDGSNRVCVDYRKLNAGVLKDGFPVPIVDEVLEKLQAAKWFTIMDLENGFFHVPIKEESKKYTAFVTQRGLFEFNRAPFGFCNSPAVFIRFVSDVFRDLISANVLDLYMDDIVIHGKTDSECFEKTALVLKTAAENGLRVKWKKCHFIQQSISFLGHHVKNGTVSPGVEKISAVKNFREPKNVKAVQAFLGLTGYFRKFIQDYSQIARPLTDLLKKDVPFKMCDRELDAFRRLKEELVKEPVLRLYEQGAKTELHTDASKDGFGAVLMQWFDGKLHPVFYWSKKSSDAEAKKHSYILEAKCVYLATKKFRRYLLGVTYKLVTDCIAFKQTLKKADVPNEVLPWVMYLQDFTFEVEHRSGTRLRHVDCLSRYPLQVMVVSSEVTARIRSNQQKDEMIKVISEILVNKPYGAYFMKGGVLYYAKNGLDLIVLPRSMEKQIILEVHNNGHFGVQKTIHTLNQQYWIPQVEQKVRQVISNCVKCILFKKKTRAQGGIASPDR